MNKYRLLQSYDDFNEFKCLACKKDFIHRDRPDDWACCPFCKVAWDGEFVKRNQRYQENSYSSRDDTYDILPSGRWECRKPRLLLLVQGIRRAAFSPPYASPQWPGWRMSSHCLLSPDIFIQGKSVSAHMNGQFNRIRDHHDQENIRAVRLVRVTGTTVEVIREEFMEP